MPEATVVNPALDQRRMALKVANWYRSAGVHVQREIKAGELTVGDALWDARGQSLRMYAVLGAQRGWGTTKVEKFCREHRFSPSRKVRELTNRQRFEITAALEDR